MILRREIQVEDLAEVLWLDADAGVLDPHLHPVARARRRRQPQGTAVRHRLARVDRQVEKRLPQHRRVAVDRRARVGGLDLDADAVLARLGLDDRQNLVEERRHAHGLQPQILGPRELQESLDHLIEPADLALDHFDVLERARLDAGRAVAARSAEAQVPGAATGSGCARRIAARIFVRSSSR